MKRVTCGGVLGIVILVGCTSTRSPAARDGAWAGHAPAPRPREATGQEQARGAGSQTDCAADAATGTLCTAEPETVEAAARAVLCDAAPSAAERGRPPPWDHVTAPAHLDLVTRRYALTADERARLFKDGLVVPDRLAVESYAAAFEDIHRSQLPVYVSVDAVLHAVYMAHDKVLAETEARHLAPATSEALGKMHDALREAKTKYAPTTARDLDLYLTVARVLLDPPAPASEKGASDAVASVFGSDAEARALVKHATAARGLVTIQLFGRARVVDFGAFRPRAHYAPEAAERNPDRADLSHWYRAAMWLSRVEMNLVSRSSRSSSPTLDPSESPRDVALALAFADLAKQTASLEELEKVDRAWAAFAGKREDVPLRALEELAARAGVTSPDDPDAQQKLAGAIGSGYARTARTHFQMEGTTELPVIATPFGPRIPPDATEARGLVHGELPGRREIPAAEMAWVLGQDRALRYLAKDVQGFPALPGAMRAARDGVAKATSDLGTSPDLYTAWLRAVVRLADKPAGVLPSFTETDAFADMRVASTVAGYAQIRHNHVLLVPMTMDEGGCEIPDGWVDPVPAVYDALIAYAERGASALRDVGEGAAEPFARLARTLRVLSRIAQRELAGDPLDAAERRFLAMVVQEPGQHKMGYGPSSPLERGWYFHLFRAPEDAREPARLVADHFGSVQTGHVDYAGVSGATLGLFVVDTGGAPRVMVGPVTRAFQARGPMSPRWSDDDVRRIPRAEPWATSYVAPAVPAPALVVTRTASENDAMTFELTSDADLGPVTLSLLDHHNVEVSSVTHAVRGAAGKRAAVTFTFSDPHPTEETAKFGIEGLRVTAKGATFFDTQASYGFGYPDTRWRVSGSKMEREDVYSAGRRPTGPGRRL